MSDKDDIVIIIPAFNPDDKFLVFLNELIHSNYNKIIVIDDGSREDKKHYFEEAVSKYHCHLVTHSINLGQGRAYKTGFNYYLYKSKKNGEFQNTIGLIQCDCDGQHHIDDINRCAELLRKNPQKFILGVRDFRDRDIPFRSRFGNNCTTLIFKFFCGLDVKDTQTGLKGIPSFFIPKLMETPGERFEYASSVLLETKKQRIEILQFPIKTIYINDNETSHFNPLIDSLRIYSLIIKYLMSSLSAFIFDIVLFSVFLPFFKAVSIKYYIVISTYLAKVFSCTYGYVVNKKFVFENENGAFGTAIKFFVLCIIQSTCTAFITRRIAAASNWNEVLCKIIVDTVLFFISFQVQNRWVFCESMKK